MLQKQARSKENGKVFYRRKNRLAPKAKVVKLVAKAIMTWISIIGIVGMGCFILEEAHQQASFGAYYARLANNKEVALEAAQISEHIAKIGAVLNRTVGWLNPVGFVAFRNYFEVAAPMGVKSIRAWATSQTMASNDAPLGTYTVTEVVKKPTVAVAHTKENVNLVVFPSSAVYAEIEKLKGTTVKVKGELQPYKDTMEIVITSPDQIVSE